MKLVTTSDLAMEQAARQEENFKKREVEYEEARKAADVEFARSSEAIKLCHRIAQVYLPKGSINKALAEEGIGEGQRRIFEDIATDTLALGYIIDGVIYLVFRGTQPTSIKNWETDLNIRPVGSPSRHQGFQQAWKSIQGEVEKWIRSQSDEDWHLVLAGHSLGGAMATLAAMDLSNIRPIREVRTYGSPRVGLWGFRKRYSANPADPEKQKSLAQITTRYVHNADLFPHLPPPLFYCHVKEEEQIGSYSWENLMRNSMGFVPPTNLVPTIPDGLAAPAPSYKTARSTQELVNISWWCAMFAYVYLRSIGILAKLPNVVWLAFATLTRSIPIAVKAHSSVEYYSDPTLYRR